LGHLTEPEKAARKRNEINKTTLGLINAKIHGRMVSFMGLLLFLKAMWYQEWLFDITTIWALIKVGNISRLRQLAEAVYEYGKGNYKRALELLGPN
ncbi:hypothetical protein F2Q69_00030838, partial [Brassica cretica]